MVAGIFRIAVLDPNTAHPGRACPGHRFRCSPTLPAPALHPGLQQTHPSAVLKHVRQTRHSTNFLRNHSWASCEDPRTSFDTPTLGAAEGQGMHRDWCWQFDGNWVRSPFVPTRAVLIHAMCTDKDGRAQCCSRMKVCLPCPVHRIE